MEITAGDRFGASSPSKAVSASWKSPVEMPRRYSTGNSASRLRVRRAHSGRIVELNRIRSPIRREIPRQVRPGGRMSGQGPRRSWPSATFLPSIATTCARPIASRACSSPCGTGRAHHVLVVADHRQAEVSSPHHELWRPKGTNSCRRSLRVSDSTMASRSSKCRLTAPPGHLVTQNRDVRREFMLRSSKLQRSPNRARRRTRQDYRPLRSATNIRTPPGVEHQRIRLEEPADRCPAIPLSSLMSLDQTSEPLAAIAK